MKTSGCFSGRGYGWQKDLPDQRDHFYAAPSLALGSLPAKVDLRSQCPPVLASDFWTIRVVQ